MTKHEIILYWSGEDEAFVAEVPELAGCAAEGATRQEHEPGVSGTWTTNGDERDASR